VLTSATAAAELKRRAVGWPRRVAAIGRATAEAWGEVDLVAPVSTQEGLLAALPRPAGRVLFAGAEGARRLLTDELGADVVPLYRTVELHPDAPPAGDLVVLASASAARAFGALGVDLPAVSIGPLTTEAARRAGVRVVAEAATQDLDGLVSAIASAACSSPS
jgi:uroporphyrinogen-III synthase